MQKNVSALSKMTVRANAIVSGIARKTIAATYGVSPPHTRRANQNSIAAVASVKRYAGRRAASSVGPKTSIAAASAAKYTTGLSRYGSPSSRGMT